MATVVVEIAHGRLTRHLGGYDDWVEARARSGPTPASPPSRGRESGRAAAHGAGPVKATKKRAGPAVRELRARVEAVEAQIHALERRLAEIGHALSDPALYTDGERARGVATERQSAEEQIAWLLREWEELSMALAAHE